MNNNRRPNQNRFGGNRKPQNRNMGYNDNRQVNPWLSGGSGGLLNSNQSLDSQSPLTLASNLLTSILSPPQPPSLLSLGNINAPFIGGGGYGPNRGGYGRDRFMNNQGPRRDFVKRDNFKGKRFGVDRKPNRKPQDGKKVDSKSVEGDQSSSDKQENKSTTEDVEMKDTEGNSTEKDTKGDNTDETGGENGKKIDEKDKTSQFADIAPCMLYCHICRKHMWDDLSFEKHLEGRPHKMMINELDQSYKLKVELLRHEIRVTEQQRENDIQRAQRKGKSGKASQKSNQRGFCTMCDLNFLGTLPAHRRNDRHQRLKKFLHPKCFMCDKEFYTRLEWDDHKLTGVHLKKLEELRKEKRPHLGLTEFDVVDFIEDANDGIIAYDIDLKVDGVRNTFTEEERQLLEDGDSTIKDESIVKDESIIKDDSIVKDASTVKEDQNETLESKDGAKDDDEKDDSGYKAFPKFAPGVVIGEEFVEETKGYLCRACYRFMMTEEDSKVHCHTVMHYNNSANVLRVKERIIQKLQLEKKRVEGDESVVKEIAIDDTGAETKVNGNGTEDGVMEIDINAIKAEPIELGVVKIELLKTEVVKNDPEEKATPIGGEKYDPEEESEDEVAPKKRALEESKTEDDDTSSPPAKVTKVEEPPTEVVVTPEPKKATPTRGSRGRGRRGRRN